MKQEKLTRIALIVLGALVLVLGITTIVLFKRYGEVRNNPQKYVQQSTDDLVKKVGQLIDLPAGEAPTIATVVNLEKLKGQPFFAKASVGDKVLIYSIARKVYLYNPGSNHIVEVAPLGAGSTPDEGGATAENATQ
jgi:hypothetical protein